MVMDKSMHVNICVYGSALSTIPHEVFMKTYNAHHRPLQTQKLVQKDTKLLVTNGIGWVLQGGVIISATLILLGLFLLPTRPGGLSITRLLNFPQTLDEVRVGLLTWHAQAFIALGLLVLIATPVARVAVSILVFTLERDRKYIIITIAVLAILL